MKDRVPANPGRVLITPENGSAPFYATMARADNPTQEGDPLNKNTLLKDATAALFGLTADAVPDDVLSVIKGILNNNTNDISALKASGAKIAYGNYVGTGTYGSSNKNSLTFGFKPKFFILQYSSGTTQEFCFYIDGSEYGNSIKFYQNISWKQGVYFSANDNGIEWYSNKADVQYNYSGRTYNYVAIG